MKTIIFIEANIISVSPFFTGDDEGEILIDNENNQAFLPATSIAGAFRSYLSSIGEKPELLFGYSIDSKMSKIFIRDGFAQIKKITRRNGLRIDDETGSNVEEAKIDYEYFDEGLELNLVFEIHDAGSLDKELKAMIYKALSGLNKGLIRLGGHKSSGLGIFEIKRVFETEYKLSNFDALCSYLKKEQRYKYDITKQIKEIDNKENYVEFIMKGRLSTPLIIKAPDTFNAGGPDDTSIMNEYGKYIIPGSSFKGVLRSRIEMIAGYFGSRNKAKEMFGDLFQGKKSNTLSRVFVKESTIDNTDYLKKIKYNRIKLDKFTSGVKNSFLMDDIPVKGNVDFNIIYRKKGNGNLDKYAIGIIVLALRDLGMENLSLGGNSNIGRGKYKADSLVIKNGEEVIDIDFNNETIDNDKTLSEYVKSVNSFNEEVESNG